VLRPTTMDNELQKIKVRKFAESLRNLHFILSFTENRNRIRKNYVTFIQIFTSRVS